MVFNVTITESYTYSRRVECADEDELSRILHEDVPLVADMGPGEVERLRQGEGGLHLTCDYRW